MQIGQRARRLVACSWIISSIFSAPMLFLYEEKLIQGQTQCWIELGKPWRWQLYMSLVSATLFFFPALIITACYAIIVRTIWVKGAVFIPAGKYKIHFIYTYIYYVYAYICAYVFNLFKGQGKKSREFLKSSENNGNKFSLMYKIIKLSLMLKYFIIAYKFYCFKAL